MTEKLCPFRGFKECYESLCMAWESAWIPPPDITGSHVVDKEGRFIYPELKEDARGGDCRLLKSKYGGILAAMFGRKEDD